MKRTGWLSLALALAACGNIFAPDGPMPNVVVEIEYRNPAAKQYFGYWLNGLGDVYQYNRSGATWEFQDSVTWSRETLDNKFTPIKNFLHTRPKGEVENVSTLINSLTGQYSAPKHPCAGQGMLTYYAYKYEIETARYSKRIVLREAGDSAMQETSAAAQQLVSYIRSLNLVTEPAGCDP